MSLSSLVVTFSLLELHLIHILVQASGSEGWAEKVSDTFLFPLFLVYTVQTVLLPFLFFFFFFYVWNIV